MTIYICYPSGNQIEYRSSVGLQPWIFWGVWSGNCTIDRISSALYSLGRASEAKTIYRQRTGKCNQRLKLYFLFNRDCLVAESEMAFYTMHVGYHVLYTRPLCYTFTRIQPKWIGSHLVLALCGHVLHGSEVRIVKIKLTCRKKKRKLLFRCCLNCNVAS